MHPMEVDPFDSGGDNVEVSAGQAQSAADELDVLFETEPGHSGGARWRREDVYEGRLR